MNKTPRFSTPLPIKAARKPLTFGDFVAGGYQTWGKHEAEEMIRLVVKAGIIGFRGQHRIIIA